MARRERAIEPRLWLFERWLAATFVVAWLSLGSQIELLVGSRGLVPFADLLARVEANPSFSWVDAPSLFLFGASDAALWAGCVLGLVGALLALFGVWPRLLLGLNAVGYLSYAVACGVFLSFQWDNLLLECAFLATLTGVASGGPWRVFLFRVLLFKLYFESGLAKYQSHLGDWLDGSAMTFYYETAPLPTSLAWYAHALPEGWHQLESWFTLLFEIGGALLVFSPRPTRLVLFFLLSGFQVVNMATANYGFFSPLSLGLHVFLLDPLDVRRAGAFAIRGARRFALARRGLRGLLRARRAASRLRVRVPFGMPRFPRRAGAALAVLVSVLYVGVSLASGVRRFVSRDVEVPLFAALDRALAPFRVINTYHLFAHITRERVEPEFQTWDGSEWTAHPLYYKPGPVDRSGPFVAPHQPRVDFLLWFYGLRHEGRPPPYVANLLRRLCHEPERVQELFTTALPESPDAARVAFHRYRFTTPEARAQSGDVWTREPVGRPRALSCSAATQGASK